MSALSHKVLTDITDRVATITLNVPERRNALDPELAKELAGIIRSMDADTGTGALVITGSGKGFCAGANLDNLTTSETTPDDKEETLTASLREERRAAYTALYEPFLALRSARKPTVAAVNGAAVGAGLNLLLAADIAIASEEAKILSGFLRIGLHPGGGNTSMLTERVGPQAAAALTLFGETVDGKEAKRIGLVHDCVSAENLAEKAHSMAAKAASFPLASTIRVKETLGLSRRADFHTVLEAETTAQIWTTTLPETAERLRAARK